MKKLIINYEKLFELANERHEVAILENNLFNLYQLTRTNISIRRLLYNKILSPDQKLQQLQKLFGFNASKLFYELIYLLLTKNQIFSIYSVYSHFSNIVKEKLNMIIIQAISPILLSIENKKALKNILEITLNKKIILKNFVDPTLLGGLILKLPDGQIFDLSFKRNLENLKYYILEK